MYHTEKIRHLKEVSDHANIYKLLSECSHQRGPLLKLLLHVLVLIPARQYEHIFCWQGNAMTRRYWHWSKPLTCFVNFHYPVAVGRAQSVWTFHWPTGHWSVSSTPALCYDCSVNLPSASSHLSLTCRQHHRNTVFCVDCSVNLPSASSHLSLTCRHHHFITVFCVLTALYICLQLLHICL